MILNGPLEIKTNTSSFLIIVPMFQFFHMISFSVGPNEIVVGIGADIGGMKNCVHVL